MADWQRTLDIAASWRRAKAGEITQREMAAEIAAKLRAMPPLDDVDAEQTRGDLAEEFDILAKDEETSDYEFNETMRCLYDWGDIDLGGGWPRKKVCWVDTIGLPRRAAGGR